MTHARYHRGITLIEIVIYLGLYALLMGGAVLSAYALISTSAHNQAKALVQEEGNYLISKIDWALGGAKGINDPNDANPLTTDYGTRLSVSRYDPAAGEPIVFSITDGVVYMRRSGNPAVAISNADVRVACPLLGCFAHTSASGDGINPESLTATFTVSITTSDGRSYHQDFSTVKYIRK